MFNILGYLNYDFTWLHTIQIAVCTACRSITDTTVVRLLWMGIAPIKSDKQLDYSFNKITSTFRINILIVEHFAHFKPPSVRYTVSLSRLPVMWIYEGTEVPSNFFCLAEDNHINLVPVFSIVIPSGVVTRLTGGLSKRICKPCIRFCLSRIGIKMPLLNAAMCHMPSVL